MAQAGCPGAKAGCSTRRQARVAAAALLAVLLVAGRGWASPASTRPLDPADRFRHPLRASRYSELWNYLIQLDDGAVLNVCFLLSNIGVFKGSAEVSLSLTRVGAAPILVDHDLELDDYFERRGEGRFGIATHSVQHGAEGTRVRLRGPRVSLDLLLRPWMDGFSVGDGRARFPGEPHWYHRVLVEIPRADATGRLVLDGTPRDIRGAAYSDHVIQTVPATSFSTRWLTLRGFYPDHTVMLIGFDVDAAVGGGARLLGLVTDRRGVLGVSTDYRATAQPGAMHRDARGYDVPAAYALQLELGPGLGVEGTFAADGLLVRNALLERLSWLRRKLVRLFAGRPIIYRFRSAADLRLHQPGQPPLLLGGGGVYHEVAILGK